MTRTTFLKHMHSVWAQKFDTLGFISVATDNGESYPMGERFQKTTADHVFDVQLEFRNKTDFVRVVGTMRFPALQIRNCYLRFFTRVGHFFSFSKLKVDQLDVIEPLLWDDVEDSVLPMFATYGCWTEFDKLVPADLSSLVIPQGKFRIGTRSEHALFMARMHLQRDNFQLASEFAAQGLAIEGMETTRDYDEEFREILRTTAKK